MVFWVPFSFPKLNLEPILQILGVWRPWTEVPRCKNELFQSFLSLLTSFQRFYSALFYILLHIFTCSKSDFSNCYNLFHHVQEFYIEQWWFETKDGVTQNVNEVVNCNNRRRTTLATEQCKTKRRTVLWKWHHICSSAQGVLFQKKSFKISRLTFFFN